MEGVRGREQKRVRICGGEAKGIIAAGSGREIRMGMKWRFISERCAEASISIGAAELPWYEAKCAA